jgi:hypothetical protein
MVNAVLLADLLLLLLPLVLLTVHYFFLQSVQPTQEDIDATIVYNWLRLAERLLWGECNSTSQTLLLYFQLVLLMGNVELCTITTLNQTPSHCDYEDRNVSGYKIGWYCKYWRYKAIYNFVVTNTEQCNSTNITVTDGNANVASGLDLLLLLPLVLLTVLLCNPCNRKKILSPL